MDTTGRNSRDSEEQTLMELETTMLAHLSILCTAVILTKAQVVFVNHKPLYEIQNRQPAETVVVTFKAEDQSDPSSRLVYDLYEADDLPFRIDRYSGQLSTTTELNLPVGSTMTITLVATNPLNGQDVRILANLKITGALNRYSPTFPSNGTTIFLERNATTSQTIWIADSEDADTDEANNDMTLRLKQIEPSGWLEFINETGELKLLRPAKDFPDKPVTVVVTACNGPAAVPPRCGVGVVTVEIVLPQQGQVMDLLTDITAEKLSALANAVEVMSEYAKKDVKVAQSMVNVLAAVLSVDETKLRSVMTTDVSVKLTGSVGSYASDAVMPNKQTNMQVKTANLAINLLDIGDDFTDSTLQLSSACGHNFSQLESMGQNFSFAIPSAVVRSGTIGKDGQVRVSLVQYDNSKLFQPGADEPEVIRKTIINCTSYYIADSPVVVAEVKGANTDHLAEPVTFRMPKPTPNLKYKCVYWDKTGNRWASDGITVSKQSGSEIECSARHMTAFSLLFDPTPDEGIAELHKFALSLISYIGCGLSIFGCLATVVTYLFFRHLHADNAGKILINLCVAIGALNSTFVIGSLMSTSFDSTASCATITALVHFFSMASFMWMGIEAFNMYQLIIKVFFTIEQKHFVLRRAVLGWGLPAVVAMSTSLLEVYNGEEKPYGDECRLTPRNTFVYYVAFLSPIAIIVLCNTIVFIMVIFVLCKPRPDFVNMSGKNTGDKQKSIKGAQVHGTLAVMFLLGVTWIFGALAVSHARLLFQYVFCITNSIQGFLIFVFRCVERQEARMAWALFLKTGRRKPLPVSSSRRPTTSTRSVGFSTSSIGSDARPKNDKTSTHETAPSRKPLLQQRSRATTKPTNGDRLSAFMMEDYSFAHIDQDGH